jgi:perosamine synthetase
MVVPHMPSGDSSASPAIKIPLSRPDISDLERAYVRSVLSQGWISGTAEMVRRFERGLCERLGRAHTVAVANGTLALELALRGLQVGPGDEVIVPALTFAAPAMSVLAVGASVVLGDVDPGTWTLSPASARACLSSRTRAIIAVDALGHPADYDELCRLGVPVIEDAAQAHGAYYKDRPAGAWGEVSVFSFHANKAISTGEGGSVSTDSPALAEQMRLIANHGMTALKPYVHEVLGRNYRMTALSAAVGVGQLERWPELIAARNRVSRRYREMLADAGCHFRPCASWASCSCWLQVITTSRRDEVVTYLRSCGIDARPLWPPLQDQPVLRGAAAECPVAAGICRRALWLPTYAAMTDEQISTVAGHVIRVLRPGVAQRATHTGRSRRG